MSYIPFPQNFFPVGSILFLGGSVVPDGWLLCDGSVVSTTTYKDLYKLIGIVYGDGDGSGTQFNLPDARGKVLIGAGTGLSTRIEGETGGDVSHTLIQNECGAHFHFLFGEEVYPPDPLAGFEPSTTYSWASSSGGPGGSSSSPLIPNLDSLTLHQGSSSRTQGFAGGDGYKYNIVSLKTRNTDIIYGRTANTDPTQYGDPHNNLAPSQVVGGMIIKY